MKFKFKVQPFQTEAAKSIVSVFNGQPKYDIVRYRRDIGERTGQTTLDEMDDEFDAGYRNADIELNQAQLLANIKDIQIRNNIKQSSTLISGLGAVSLDVEMETGTGKTYVYIKTMFELYKNYGWGKYIVVVPSIAIREGVKKSFEMTQDHFMELYGIKARFFIYNSSNLHQLDEFSHNAGINVMIINTQAFNTTLNEDKSVAGSKGNEAARIIYTKRDEFASRRPIDVIKANKPIIILDEPQRMAGQATQNALKRNFNPLFSLNFSATHKTSYNLVYVLDALDAFKKKLVKRIEVKGFDVNNLTGTSQYLYLSSISIDKNKPPVSRIEFEKKLVGSIKRFTQRFEVGDSLYEASNQLEQYKDLYITEVNPINGTVSFSSGLVLKVGEASGNVNENDIKRIQIRETIASHFEKEERLFEQGIKCLSLFFIDDVSKYRLYDEEGQELIGEYGKIFEEEYVNYLNEHLNIFDSAYQAYLRNIEVQRTHNGYFSIDKNKRFINSDVKRGSDITDDISAYDLILKNKERLLSFEEPTRFIFSHSALREGWDNPNVFQICTLKQTSNITTKRQEVGRGLRLCVNTNGDRQDSDALGEAYVHDLNTLTVIASESYQSFVTGLQKEITDDLYKRPTLLNIAFFENRTVYSNEQVKTFSTNESQAIYNYLVRNDYVDDFGHVTDKYREDVNNEMLKNLPEQLSHLSNEIHALVQSVYDESAFNSMIKDAHETKIKDNPLNDNWPHFIELWNKINKKYAYTVEFDSNELINNSIHAIDRELTVSKLTYTLTQGEQIGAEIQTTHRTTQTLKNNSLSAVRYDLIGKIAEATNLTRRTVGSILLGIDNSKQLLFTVNPEEFINKVSKIINSQKANMVVEHIAYQPSSEDVFSQEIFHMNKSSLEYSKALQLKKSIQDYTFVDGLSENSIEKKFANDLDTADEVLVFAKLPRGRKGFYIPTPVGDYSPDWAITFKQGTVRHIFFIAETKGSMDTMQLKPIEQAKISCAKKLFNEFSTEDVKYHDVDSYDSLLSIIGHLN
ncbi:MAG: DEAD/DEAH box helicase family protein [Erysipelotrichia bacterium]|jgi:type III restriction enzyme|nr:DEAD/DEAH box helicase family protein [Erysipelotrichia bacterium]